MFYEDNWLDFEANVLAARTEGLESAAHGFILSDGDHALFFVQSLREQLDTWPEDHPGSYEEYASGLAAIWLETICESSLSPPWQEIARVAVMTVLGFRITELDVTVGLPPAVLANRIGKRAGDDFWDLCEILRGLKPTEARQWARKWLAELRADTGLGESEMYQDVRMP